MRANDVSWSDDAVGVDVPLIESVGGVNNVLRRGAISTEAKSSRLRILGIIVDANGDAQQRWIAVRNRCSTELPDLPPLPDQVPSSGFLCSRSDGFEFGVWIMPDNQHQGALEHFLLGLVPSDARWHVFADRSSPRRRSRGHDGHEGCIRPCLLCGAAWLCPVIPVSRSLGER